MENHQNLQEFTAAGGSLNRSVFSKKIIQNSLLIWLLLLGWSAVAGASFNHGLPVLTEPNVGTIPLMNPLQTVCVTGSNGQTMTMQFIDHPEVLFFSGPNGETLSFIPAINHWGLSVGGGEFGSTYENSSTSPLGSYTLSIGDDTFLGESLVVSEGECAASCTPPTVYEVTGGGTYCFNTSGTPVGLSDSESGMTYQLQIDGSDSGDPVAGTGEAISFGNQSVAGTYTVVATNTAGGCTASMTGSVEVASTNFCVTDLTITDFSDCNGQNTTCTSDNTFTANFGITFGEVPPTGSLVISCDAFSYGLLEIPVSLLSGTSITFSNFPFLANYGDFTIDAGFSETGSLVYSEGSENLMTSICSPAPSCEITQIEVANVSACDNNDTNNDSSDDTFTADVTVTFAYAPTGGTLTLKRDGMTLASTDDASLDCTTSWTFSGVEMTADGAAYNLTAEFWDGRFKTCEYAETALGNAPASCSCTPATEICNGVDDDCDTEIDENNTLAATFNCVNVTCHGSTNGTIFTTVSGGTAPFTFSWSNNKTTQNINLLAAGVYTLTITDSGNCSKTNSAQITSPAAITMSVATTTTSATVTSGGGTGSHLYNRTGATTFQSNPVFIGLAPGATYIFKTQDANGCQKSMIKKLPSSMAPAGSGATKAAAERGENQNQTDNQTMLVFPNPADNFLKINFLEDEQMVGQVEIFNQIGQRVLTQNLSVESGEEGFLPVRQLPQGTYFLVLKDDFGQMQTARFSIFRD